jgi:hypothetical protein
MFKFRRVHLPARPQPAGGDHRWRATGRRGESPPGAAAVPRPRRLAARGVTVLVTAAAIMAGTLSAVPGARASATGGPSGSGSVSSYWNQNGTQANVYYVGANHQLYTWWWTGSAWVNAELGSGERALPLAGLASMWNPDGTQANVYYVGYDGQLYNWWWTGSAWVNGPL